MAFNYNKYTNLNAFNKPLITNNFHVKNDNIMTLIIYKPHISFNFSKSQSLFVI